jgi:hypothetical protein
MFRYWTVWNFHWFLAEELGYCNLNGALRTSIINTSLVGAYMAYIKPRKIKLIFNKNSKKPYIYNVPYYQIILGDLLFHQLPLIRLFFKEKDLKICGLYSVLPVLTWFAANKIQNIEYDEIYGTKMLYLSFGSAFITTSLGIYHHFLK